MSLFYVADTYDAKEQPFLGYCIPQERQLFANMILSIEKLTSFKRIILKPVEREMKVYRCFVKQLFAIIHCCIKFIFPHFSTSFNSKINMNFPRRKTWVDLFLCSCKIRRFECEMHTCPLMVNKITWSVGRKANL